jgi:hypothetical protein
MRTTRGPLATVAEIGLWLTAAVLVAAAVGMHLPSGLLSSASPAASGAATPSVGFGALSTPTLQPSLAPRPSAAATLSPLAARLQARLAAKTFEFQATGTGSESATGEGLALDFTLTGSLSYRAGDEADTTKLTAQGQTVANDSVYAGSFAYERSNGGPWVKKPRKAYDDDADWRIFLSPKRLFVDTGVETKNGASLHRLEVADPAALGSDLDATGLVSNARATVVFWVKADGTPVVLRVEGTWDQPLDGVQAHVTIAEEFVLTRLSGVAITPPKNPWRWVVDAANKLAFGLPPDWKASDVNRLIGLTTYADAAYTFGYRQDNVLLSLSAAATQVEAGFVDPVVGQPATTVGGQAAVQFGVHRSKQKDYASVTVVMYSGRCYQFIVLGSVGHEVATDSMARQVLATVELTS